MYVFQSANYSSFYIFHPALLVNLEDDIPYKDEIQKFKDDSNDESDNPFKVKPMNDNLDPFKAKPMN